MQEFRKRGVAIAAISADSPAESRKLSDSEGYAYTFLSDPKAEVIRSYGVLHARAGENNRDIARPAEFLVDATGAIRWVKLTDDVRVRARPEEVIQVIDRLMVSAMQWPGMPGLLFSLRHCAV